MIKLIFSVLLAISAPVFAQEAEHTISVSGVGMVTTTPDIATVSLGVTTEARTALEALSGTSVAMKKVIEILGVEGVLEADIQTTGLSLYPSFENNSRGNAPRVVGYRAQNMVSITVRELDDLGRVLDKVSEAGGNLIQSIQFGRDETTGLMNEARQAAVLNARQKADLFARAAGVSVGPVISISEAGGSGPSPRNMARAQMESMAMDVPIAQGELTLSATVHVEYLIE